MATTEAQCGIEGCRVAETGECANGVTVPEECEHFRREETAEAPDADWKPIHSGIELDAEQASAILRRGWCPLVFVAGGVDSGKTTLVTALYEQFQQGRFAGLSFAGSETLHAWERHAHLSRTASFGDVPDTERTAVEPEFRFVHLRVASSNQTRDLLFSNVSGELFEAMRDSPEECRRAVCLGRASRFVLLLDGNKLVSVETRQSELADARGLLRGLLDTEALASTTPIDLMVSKWDLVVGAGEEEPVQRGVERLIGQLKEAPTAPTSLTSSVIAARPRFDSGMAESLGLDEFLVSCMKLSTLPRGSRRTPHGGEWGMHRFVARDEGKE